MEVSNLGEIKTLTMPDGWLNTRKLLGQFGNSYLYYFGPEGEPDLQFALFYRGKLMASLSGRNFRQILAKESRTLSAREVLLLSEVLGNLADPDLFDLTEARAENLQGKPVLTATGIYPELYLENFTVFIDAGNDGCAVQEIVFSAPPMLYQRYLPAVLGCLESVQWR